jgi:hypothetical protein
MPARCIHYLATIPLWALPIETGAQSSSTPPPEMLRVTRTADDGGEGSLRWAIERNNAAPGHFRIELAPAGQAPVIKLASPLPAIKGPVAIEGAAWKRSVPQMCHRRALVVALWAYDAEWFRKSGVEKHRSGQANGTQGFGEQVIAAA